MPQLHTRRPWRRSTIALRRLQTGLAQLAVVAWLVAVTGCAAAVRTTGPGVAPERTLERPGATTKPGEGETLDERPTESTALPDENEAPRVRVLVVKASAYNSTRAQTDGTPSLGAWGDRLQPGMKVIAVSKDLIAMGLRRGQRVRIAGLDGEYVVLDRMPSRWRQKIDIFMGRDVRSARAWGIRDVEISWTPEHDELAESAPPEASAEAEGPEVDSESD